ncbi:MAG: hypothetical protein Q8L14_16450 [Myxococcales bacterium]|nr:hypothetical protein [Myxococcales bacterium]
MALELIESPTRLTPSAKPLVARQTPIAKSLVLTAAHLPAV